MTRAVRILAMSDLLVIGVHAYHLVAADAKIWWWLIV